jgi:hypothetical protein
MIAAVGPATEQHQRPSPPDCSGIMKENEMNHLVLGAQRFLLNLRNIPLEHKLSDWELARTQTPIHWCVQGYIQSDKVLINCSWRRRPAAPAVRPGCSPRRHLPLWLAPPVVRAGGHRPRTLPPASTPREIPGGRNWKRPRAIACSYGYNTV